MEKLITSRHRSVFQFSLRRALVMTCVLGTLGGLLGPWLVKQVLRLNSSELGMGTCLLVMLGGPVVVQLARRRPWPIVALVYVGAILLLFAGLPVYQYLGSILLAGCFLSLGCWVEILARGIVSEHWPTAVAITVGSGISCYLSIVACA